MTTETDTALSIDMLIAADIEAQRAIREWEAHRQRIQGALKPLVEDNYEGETGRAAWEISKGPVDWEKMFHALMRRIELLMLEHDIMSDGFPAFHARDGWRKPVQRKFVVRPLLKRAPAPQHDMAAPSWGERMEREGDDALAGESAE